MNIEPLEQDLVANKLGILIGYTGRFKDHHDNIRYCWRKVGHSEWRRTYHRAVAKSREVAAAFLLAENEWKK